MISEFEFYIIFAIFLVIINTYFYYKYAVIEPHNCRDKRDRLRGEKKALEKKYRSLEKDYLAGVDVKDNLDQALITQQAKYEKLYDKYDNMADLVYESKRKIVESQFLNDFIVADYEMNVRKLKDIL